MIASIIITSLRKAEDKPFKPDLEQNVWISAVDPEDKNKINKLRTRLKAKGVVHFAQYFRDFSDEDDETYIKNTIEEEGPREQHINNIISFLDPFVSGATPYHLGVNCFAGIARSTAIGIIAWVMQGLSPEEALKRILAVRAEAWPNLRMLRFASARLGIDILSTVSDWKTKEKNNLIYEL